jgi:hypothetical protein
MQISSASATKRFLRAQGIPTLAFKTQCSFLYTGEGFCALFGNGIVCVLAFRSLPLWQRWLRI